GGSGTTLRKTFTWTPALDAATGPRTLTLNATDGEGNTTTKDVTITVTAPADTTPPVLTEITPVPDPTADNTPDYTFSSTEAGAITYAGGCASVTAVASTGSNTITLASSQTGAALPDGTYSTCTLTVTDGAGNASSPLTISPFTIDRSASLPELPRANLDTTYNPPVGGTIHVVMAGQDLQAVLNLAQPGDIIELEAGATFTGNFTLPKKTGNDWIYIRTSNYAGLPAPGSRVGPANASAMARVQTTNHLPVFSAAYGAHNYRFVGLEVASTNTGTALTTSSLFTFVDGGSSSALEWTLEEA
ncbi:MAG: hypothetical protein AAB728_04535, partial [Patescibacteria group bacterium]